MFVISDGQRAAIHKRPEKGLLAGLYELPNLLGRLDRGQALEKVESWGLKALSIQPLPEAKHIFSHVEWHMTGYAVLIDVQSEKIKEDFLFVEPERTEREYPVPAAFAAYMEYLNVRLGQERFR